MASSSSYSTPCAACKFLRRKCMPGCIFASYFPPEEPQKFANVHKVFGASNVTKFLNEVLPHQREDVVSSLAYEAEARLRDPVYGCVGIISFLQRQVQRLQKEIDAVKADLIRSACNEITNPTSFRPIDHHYYQFDRRVGFNEGIYYQFHGINALPYNYTWYSDQFGDVKNNGGGGEGNI